MQLDRLYADERRRINEALNACDVTSGRDRRGTIGDGLRAVTRILAQFGFSLDMVSGDEVLGRGGVRQLAFRRTHPDSSAGWEHPQITNSVVSFAWESMARPEPCGIVPSDRMEVVAYVS